MKTEAEIGVMNAKNSQQPLEAGRDRNFPPLGPSESAVTLTSDSQAPELRIDFCCWKHPVCGDLLHSPRKLTQCAQNV